MTIAEAKERLSIPILWQRFNLKGQPAKSCLCPFHEDRTNSFSVFRGRDGGDAFKCFSECGRGDVVDFFQLATGLPKTEACHQFIRLAGGVSSAPKLILPPIESRGQFMKRHLLKTANADPEKARQREKWPMFESPLSGEDDTPFRALDALAKLRHVSLDGVRLMAEHGLLYFAAWKDKPAWIITDSARVNAQARRMDGKKWEGINAKAQTLPGSQAAWLIGAEESVLYKNILFCEGGPDLLAAHHFIRIQGREADTTAVAMMGASNRIPDEQLPFFVGKRIRIMEHADLAGSGAASKWQGQLEAAGATVDVADFTGLLMADGTPVKDLNDCTRINSEQYTEMDGLIPNEN